MPKPDRYADRTLRIESELHTLEAMYKASESERIQHLATLAQITDKAAELVDGAEDNPNAFTDMYAFLNEIATRPSACGVSDYWHIG